MADCDPNASFDHWGRLRHKSARAKALVTDYARQISGPGRQILLCCPMWHHGSRTAQAVRSRSAAAPLLQQMGDYRLVRDWTGRHGDQSNEAEQKSLDAALALKVTAGTVAAAHRVDRFHAQARPAARHAHNQHRGPSFGVGRAGRRSLLLHALISGQSFAHVLAEIKQIKTHSGQRRRAERVAHRLPCPLSASPSSRCATWRRMAHRVCRCHAGNMPPHGTLHRTSSPPLAAGRGGTVWVTISAWPSRLPEH